MVSIMVSGKVSGNGSGKSGKSVMGLARRVGCLEHTAADLQPFGPGRRGTGSVPPWLRRQWHGYAMAMLSQCDGNGHGNVTAI